MTHLSKRDKRAKVSATEARRRKEVALAELRELEVRKKRGELVEVAAVNTYIGGCIIRARDILLRIGPELRDRLAQETDPIRCDELVTAEINQALEALSEYRPNAK